MKKAAGLLIVLGLTVIAGNGYAQKPREVVFYNWKEYTDKSVIEDFEKQTGIKVVLKEYDTSDMMLSEVQSDPAGFDVISATDDSAALLIKSKLLAELDPSKIPNRTYIKKRFLGLPFDPKNRYSIPGIFWYATGLVVNTNFVSENIDSWAALWDKRYQGKIALLNDSRDAMAAVIKYSGFPLNSVDSKELAIVERNVGLLRENGVRFGDTLDNLDKVLSGELWISQAYSGDMVYKSKGKDHIRYVLPKEGFNVGLDMFVISVDSPHPDEAHQLINFLLEPRNAARAARTFYYPLTVDAEQFLDKEFLDNPVIYPPPEVLKKGEYFGDLGEKENEYMRIFSSMRSKAH